GMSLSAPRDKQSSKARLNWLFRQSTGELPDDLQIRFTWPSRSESTQFDLNKIMDNPSLVEEGKKGLQLLGFRVFISRRLSGRFTQRRNFIVDLEEVVPEFYREVGQYLVPWREKAPQIRNSRHDAEDVSVQALNEESSSEAISEAAG
ncbi:hypothetical protein, partial [Labrenzia sp. 011]|uniref:hypothetical protein n=1 Tax=Labrenzia sp. 011 TaxID=2171494 RepID=UPI001AD8BD73